MNMRCLLLSLCCIAALAACNTLSKEYAVDAPRPSDEGIDKFITEHLK